VSGTGGEWTATGWRNGKRQTRDAGQSEAVLPCQGKVARGVFDGFDIVSGSFLGISDQLPDKRAAPASLPSASAESRV
jgi:hypothetical protein